MIRRALFSASIALFLVAAMAGPARAEIDIGGLLGAHFYADDNELGRFVNGPSDVAPQHGVLFGLRLGWMPIARAGIEGELAFNPTLIRGGLNSFQSILHYRLQLRLNILTGRIRPFLVAGVGAASMWTDKQKWVADDTDPYVHAGGGVEYDIGRTWGVRADARILFPPSVTGNLFTEDFEILVGIYVRLGLNLPPPDRDGDGIPDTLDRCPDKAGPRENNGCPDTDSDGDGVVDRLDRCWETPGIAENDGCPDKDSDGDGLADHGGDMCPQVPGPKENVGCPDVDTDGDGIVDRLDRCPSAPENKNNYQDDDGCPDEIPIEVKKFTGIIRGINFKLNSAEILPDSFPILDEAAGVFLQNPEIHIEISGHTDSRGSAARNTELSGQRANSVRDYFIKKGLAPTRLRALGFGPSRPVDDNATDSGRAANRRVEFRLIEN